MTMRPHGWRPAALAAGFVLSLVLAASASGAVSPLPTRVLLEPPAAPARGKIFSISARLVDERGHPIGDAAIVFYQATPFGPLPIKTVTTDQTGRAALRLREAYPDRLTLGARFAGDGRHSPAQA